MPFIFTNLIIHIIFFEIILLSMVLYLPLTFNPPTHQMATPFYFLSAGSISIGFIFMRQGDTQSMNIERKILLSFIQ